jgi:hypothetical protein
MILTEIKKMFKRGDFVRVKNTTHDERMPSSRMGHILREYKTIVHYKDKKPAPTGSWMVFMTNGVVLRFHEMLLEHVKDGTDRDRKETS